MIPNIDVLTTPLEEVSHPNNTYRTVLVHDASLPKDIYRTRINGQFSGIEALKQTIYFILGTERYKFPIYSWDYGVEIFDLFGKPMPYVMSEIQRRVKEALITDNRISDVKDFTFDRNGNKLHTTFTVVSDYGNLNTDLEVAV